MEVEQAHLVSHLNGFFRVVRRLVPVLSMWAELIPGKLMGEFFQHRLHLVQLEVDHVNATHRSLKSD